MVGVCLPAHACSRHALVPPSQVLAVRLLHVTCLPTTQLQRVEEVRCRRGVPSA
jgi:hypothetical protein